MTGTVPTLDSGRLARSTNLLFQDLERQGLEGLQLELEKSISIPGVGDAIAPIFATTRTGARFVIGLHGPLTPDDPPDEHLRELKEFAPALPVILVDELVVRRNLPTATTELIGRLGYS